MKNKQTNTKQVNNNMKLMYEQTVVDCKMCLNSRFPGVPGPIIPDPGICLQFCGNAIAFQFRGYFLLSLIQLSEN